MHANPSSRSRGARASAGVQPMLGSLLVLIFAIQIATGMLLLVHFAPDAELAFESVRRLMREVPYGWLVRLVHAHGANLMVILLLVHGLHVALTGAYKGPHAPHWLSGCGLLLLTLGAALTGYILPWSQLSYWATTIATGSLDYVPWVGEALRGVVLGGERVGAPTFRRAFAAHVALIPFAMLALVALHVLLVRRSGQAGTLPRRGTTLAAEPAPRSYPDLGLEHAIAAVGLLLLLFALVFYAPQLFFPPESFEPADPLTTPVAVKPEWYFLWRYQMPRMMSEPVALVLQTLALVGLLALPWLDRGRGRHPLDRPWATAAILVAVLTWLVLTLLGYLA